MKYVYFIVLLIQIGTISTAAHSGDGEIQLSVQDSSNEFTSGYVRLTPEEEPLQNVSQEGIDIPDNTTCCSDRYCPPQRIQRLDASLRILRGGLILTAAGLTAHSPEYFDGRLKQASIFIGACDIVEGLKGFIRLGMNLRETISPEEQKTAYANLKMGAIGTALCIAPWLSPAGAAVTWAASGSLLAWWGSKFLYKNCRRNPIDPTLPRVME